MAVSISNIPRKWDVVADVIYIDNNTKAKIIFNTGASITVRVATGDGAIPGPTVSTHSKPKIKIVQKSVKKSAVKPNLDMMSPEFQQEAYRQQAMKALSEMGGSAESLKAAMMTPVVDPQFEIMKQRALMESQSKSEQLAQEMTPLTPSNMAVNEEVSDRFYFEKQE